MYDVTTIGTLTIDLYFRGEALTYQNGRFELAVGGKYFTDHFYESLGGGATNVAIGLQRHGLRVSLNTLIGNNSFKKLVIEKLEETGVSYLHSKFADNHLNISSILLAPNGEKTVINYQSPHQHLFTNDEDYKKLLRTKAVYFANAPDISYYEKLKLFKFLKHEEKLVMVNFGVVDCRRSAEQLEQIIEHIDVLNVNTHEFADLVKKHHKEIDFRKNIVKKYLGNFKNLLLIVTDGEKGSYGYTQSDIFFQEPIKPAKIIDATGAGDGYSAGFLAEYVKTRNITASMESGAKYAAKILAKIGAN